VRNYFAIAFTCVYLTLTVGVAKTTHYCMGQEKNSSLFSFTTKKCACSLFSAEVNNCCAEDSKIVKIEDDHAGGQVLEVGAPILNFLSETYSFDEAILLTYKYRFSITDKFDQPPPPVPLYQSFCSLVFYESVA
jgi:hypothetical protein